MQILRVSDIKTFVRGHLVDLEPELRLPAPIPLRNLCPGETQRAKMGSCLALSEKWSLRLRLSLSTVAICTGFIKAQGTRLEAEVDIHPVQHSIGLLAGIGEDNGA